jgi:predicted nucleic acid-binding protein
MTLVVDASVAIKWFVRETLHDDALRLLDDPDALHAPDLLVPEVTNIAWKKVVRGEIDTDQASAIVHAIRHGIPILYPSVLLHERALGLALMLNHPVYDCLYLACAETLNGMLVSADAAFLNAARKAGFGDLLHLLGDDR